MKIMRNTVQKSIVLETVNSLRNHATADAIYDEIVKIHSSIGRATVYRNLNLLSELGEIKKIEMPKGADCFDHRTFNHYHAKCLKCGKILDVNMEYIKDLEKLIKKDNGFEFTSHDIIFSGICTKCKYIN